MEYDSIEELYVKLTGNDIQLQQLQSIPTIKLWKKDHDSDVISDVSSLQSSVKSSISREDDDSVSVVSSSDETIESLQDLNDESTRHIPYNNPEQLLFGEDIDVEEHLIGIKSHLVRLIVIERIIQYGDYTTTTVIIDEILLIMKSINKSLCIISSINYFIFTHHHGDNKHFLQLYTDIYSRMVSFHTILLKLIINTIDILLISLSLKLLSYIVDIILECIINLLYHLDNVTAQGELSKAFESIVLSSLLILCSLSDHYSELIRESSIIVLYNLSIILLPLNCIRNISKDDYIIDRLLNDYMNNEFKSLSILLYKLRCNLTLESIKKLNDGYISIIESFMRIGIAKRKYPTYILLPNDCMNRLLNKDSLINKCSYWLLSRLEDINCNIRIYTLKILSHILSTIIFIEKDRQHILSYVYNCLSDDDTLIDSLYVLINTSQLYPMKDGAVKRISMMTLKGSRRYNRLKVILSLSECKYTNKGLSTVIYLLQSLAEPIIKDRITDYISIKNHHVTSCIEDKDTELLFIRNEWPLILLTLERLSKTHENNIVTLINPPLNYVKLNRLDNLPAYIWIPLIWYYLNDKNKEDDIWNISSLLWYDEACMRYPKYTFTIDDNILNKLIKHINTYLNDDLNEEFVKNTAAWKSLHQFLIPSALHHYERSLITNIPIPIADLREAEGQLNKKATTASGMTSHPLTDNSSSEVITTVSTRHPPEVTTLSSTRRGASSNYLSLKGRATPGDRGGEGRGSDGSRVKDKTSSGSGLSETIYGSRGEVNREADGRNVTSGGPVADLREAKGVLNRGGCLQDKERTSSGRADGRMKTSVIDTLVKLPLVKVRDTSMINKLDDDYTMDVLNKRDSLNDPFLSESDSKPQYDLCSCIDCRIDKMIDTYDLNDNLDLLCMDIVDCKKYPKNNVINKPLEIWSNYTSKVNGFHHKYITSLSMCYNIIPDFDIFNIQIINDIIVDDINCLSFPAKLGTRVTIYLEASSIIEPNAIICLKFPRVTGIKSQIFKPIWKESNTFGIYNSIINTNINFPYSTAIPIPINILTCIDGTKQGIKVCIYKLYILLHIGTRHHLDPSQEYSGVKKHDKLILFNIIKL